jgi:hypothetical protein
MPARLWPPDEDATPFGAELTVPRAADAPATGPPPHSEYERDPVRWAPERLGIARRSIVWSENRDYEGHQWDGTRDPLVVIAEALADWESVGVESGTGTGKSFWAAVLVLWFLACFRGARAFTFAPKEDQLRLYMWQEITKLWPAFRRLFPSAELADLRLRMIPGSDEWGAWGYSVAIRAGEQVATHAAGMHAEHMLLVYEETPGIDMSVLAAGENTCTAPHNLRLALGNPDSEDDTLHRFCASPAVRAVRISALDHPNVVARSPLIVPGAVAQVSIDRRAAQYGVGSALYDSRVRGISPAQAVDALISRTWCDAARARHGDAVFRAGKLAWGVDVANSESGDRAAIARWQGACLLEVESFACADANVLGARVVEEVRAAGGRALHVGIDSVGVGAGTVNEAKRLGMQVQSLNGGARAFATTDAEIDVPPELRQVTNEERFANLRAQMWWQMREDLRRGQIALPNDQELVADLVTPRWWTRGGKIFVEAKEEIRRRLGRSPDKGDAAVYGNWVRDRRRLKVEEETEITAFSPEMLQASVEQTYKWSNRTQRRAQRSSLNFDYGDGY